MARLAAVPECRATFQETRRFAALDQPLISTGHLLYRRPGYLAKTTDWPQPENLVVDGRRLVLTEGNEPPQVLDLGGMPALRRGMEGLLRQLRSSTAPLAIQFGLADPPGSFRTGCVVGHQGRRAPRRHRIHDAGRAAAVVAFPLSAGDRGHRDAGGVQRRRRNRCGPGRLWRGARRGAGLRRHHAGRLGGLPRVDDRPPQARRTHRRDSRPHRAGIHPYGSHGDARAGDGGGVHLVAAAPAGGRGQSCARGHRQPGLAARCGALAARTAARADPGHGSGRLAAGHRRSGMGGRPCQPQPGARSFPCARRRAARRPRRTGC